MPETPKTMKSAEEWVIGWQDHGDTFMPNQVLEAPASYWAECVKRVQADALRHAAQRISEMKISDTAWEDSERVVTLNGEPIGGTVDRPESYRWASDLCRSMGKLLIEEADKLFKQS